MLNECNLKKLEDRLKNFIKRTLCHRNKNTSNKVCSFSKLVKYLRSKFKSTIVEYEQDINNAMENAENKLELGNGKIGKGAMVYT